MDSLRKLFVIIFGLSFGMFTSIMVMINGWGLQPKSWWWIIGVYLIGQSFAMLLIQLGK